jgi:hypothetical protein
LRDGLGVGAALEYGCTAELALTQFPPPLLENNLHDEQRKLIQMAQEALALRGMMWSWPVCSLRLNLLGDT